MGLCLIAATDAFSVLSYVIPALSAAFGLGAVIFVHELGHYFVARLCGVKVEKFYVGFDIGGKAFWRKKWGETEYGIGVLPLGGYVKMLGQDDNPARQQEELDRSRALGATKSENEESLTPLSSSQAAAPKKPVTGPKSDHDPRSYLAQPVYERMAIIVAGVVMNIIFAFVVATVAYMIGVKEAPAIVGGVTPGSPAWQAGVRPGDKFVSIHHVEDPRFSDVRMTVALSSSKEPIPAVIERDGETIDLSFLPTKHTQGFNVIGVEPSLDVVVSKTPTPVNPRLPATVATPAFEPGDRITRIQAGDKTYPVAMFRDLHRATTENPGNTLIFTVERAGKEINIEVGPNRRRTLGMAFEMGTIVAVRKGSPADLAGLMPNDFIISVDDDEAIDPLTLPEALRRKGGSVVSLKVKRGEETLDLQVKLDAPTWSEKPLDPRAPVSSAALGVAYRVVNRIRGVEVGGPAEGRGVQAGDQVVKLRFIIPESEKEAAADEENELEISEESPLLPYCLLTALQVLPAETKVELTLKNGDQERKVEIDPQVSEEWFNPERGISLAPLEPVNQATGVVDACGYGWRETVESVSQVFLVLKRLTQGEVAAKNLSGMPLIAVGAGSAAQRGLPEFLLFLGLISANLAVVNLLPIPVLDGGHVVFLTYEAITGKPPNEKLLIVLQYIGLFMLLGLMLYVTTMDVHKILEWTNLIPSKP